MLYLAANVIPLSFKNNLEELNMYNYLKSKSSPSAYLKELIKKDIGGEDVYVKNNKVGDVAIKDEVVSANKITNLLSICK